MSAHGDARAVGNPQVSENLYTPGLRLLGALPAPFEQATLYSAGVVRAAACPTGAARLLELLAAPAQAALRQRCGFEPR